MEVVLHVVLGLGWSRVCSDVVLDLGGRRAG